MKNTSFFRWLDSLLKIVIPPEIVAFNFNIYESCHAHQFDVQLVGAKSYSNSNDDWACSNDFSSGENLYAFHSHDWISCLSEFANQLTEYMQTGSERSVLLSRKAVTYGFVDGDLYTIYEGGKLISPNLTAITATDSGIPGDEHGTGDGSLSPLIRHN